MAAVNYAESYERALAQAYPNVLNFGELYNVANNQTYKFVDSKTIHIPSISVTGRKNVNRDVMDGAFQSRQFRLYPLQGCPPFSIL